MRFRIPTTIALLGLACLARPFNATIQLDTPNVEIDYLNTGQLTAVMSGRIDINESFQSLVLWIPYAYREGDYQFRNDYTLRPEFLQWLQLLMNQPGSYHGPLFEIQMEQSDMGGLYNHPGTSSTALPMIYLYRNSNSQDRSNEVPYTINFTQPGRITGTITLEDYEPDEEYNGVELTVRQGTTDTLFYLSLGPGGTYSIETGLSGSAEVLAKNWHWLRKSSGPVTLGQPLNLDLSLKNGDCDGDNEVGISDYSMISAAYGSTFLDEGTFDPSADLNGDLEVGIADYAILSANYGMTGDE